jgi:hypothetical protein
MPGSSSLVSLRLCTNCEGRRTTAKGNEGREVNKDELKAFIGLTLLTSVEKRWDVSTWELFLDPLQNSMYKATMSVRRREGIRHYLTLITRGPECPERQQTTWQPSGMCGTFS